MVLKESILAQKKKSSLVNENLNNDDLDQRRKKVPSLHKGLKGDVLL
ncbi:hypothetical protein DFO70_109109 [Cytobacillus firmus]|uniref:Uncharacterized protein n=2 Tax=Cytobacillus TaxID=2675230 RepID=A0A366JQU5_CYTFI|nr:MULTISPECIES: hypothetical protein [Cytobacillus]RBP90603.1 hypothetical protein DFO70_109109 [Cytobacillus firmus]TDX46185.1 hypothetical protein DFO72_102666 [Cytobacillus oceanisediminis]